MGSSRTECSKPLASKDNEVNIAAGDSDDALVQAMTPWTLKDVMYIPGLKGMLISVRQLDEEGYHIGFKDQ
ncbi:hypothetical protein Tco_1120945 [Tanacetum coccineum]|uniref:Retrovirus-related Pol polyprotein from transposon TNT 1-94-like beta-barrel domain-containing protein n=1 Tax=Tanacetum coccineum TaxID=301880 RepID=A0ABQ5IWC1_9ASTR